MSYDWSMFVNRRTQVPCFVEEDGEHECHPDCPKLETCEYREILRKQRLAQLQADHLMDVLSRRQKDLGN